MLIESRHIKFIPVFAALVALAALLAAALKESIPGWAFLLAGGISIFGVLYGEQRLRSLQRRSRQTLTGEERFRLLVSSVRDYAIFLLDAQGRVQSWNAGAERIKGYRSEEIIGQHFSRFYPPEDVAAGKPERELGRAALEGRMEDEGWRIRKDGSRFWANVVITALKDDKGEITGFAKITRDMTEHKLMDQEREALVHEQMARAEAERVNRMKDEFLAVVSHELRTPLTPILGWTQMLETGKLDPSMLQKGLQSIRRNVQTQVRLVEELLDISRVVSGKVRMEFAPVGLAQVVDAAMIIVQPLADEKQVKLHFGMDESVGPVLGDSDRLEQVVWNLLSNGVKFNHPGGSVDIQLRANAATHQAELEITDTGEGIDAAFLPRLFKRFSQFDSSSTRQHGGLGLGLSIVAELVRLHGGTVTARSKGRGAGATFTVRLPLAVISSVPRGGRVAAPLDDISILTGKRLLVVDDDPDTLEMLTLILQSSGAELATAASVDEALALVEKSRPDLIVTDIGMPGKDGYELLREIQRRGLAIPAIAVTAFARGEDKRRAAATGFMRHIAKPVRPEELREAVAEALKN